jgi:hypothetical protein
MGKVGEIQGASTIEILMLREIGWRYNLRLIGNVKCCGLTLISSSFVPVCNLSFFKGRPLIPFFTVFWKSKI